MSPKQKIFVNEYLKCFNATEAARRAGYKGSGDTLAAVGYENLRKPQIAVEIKAHFSASAMSAEEALQRLGDMARANLGDFTDVQHRDDLRDHPKAHLVKKLTVDISETGGRVVTVTKGEGKKAVTTETTFRGKLSHKLRFELYDAQAALVHIGRHHKIFTDVVEHDVKHDLSKTLTNALKEAYGNDNNNGDN